MADEFAWGVWLSTGHPYQGRAHGVMKEDVFRRLLKSLTEVLGDTDRAMDRIKEIMVEELNRVRIN